MRFLMAILFVFACLFAFASTADAGPLRCRTSAAQRTVQRTVNRAVSVVAPKAKCGPIKKLLGKCK